MGKSIPPNGKKRNWATVVYPESAPTDWIEILKLSGVQAAISPLHDKDINPDEHEKKAHWHVILTYGSPTTFNNVKGLVDRIGGVGQISLDSVRGYYRYFTHKDNPEKYQYDEKDIRNIGGFNILDFVEMTKSEVSKIKKDLHMQIRALGIVEYSAFMDWVLENGTPEEYDVAGSHTLFFQAYIGSRRHVELATIKPTLQNRLGGQHGKTSME